MAQCVQKDNNTAMDRELPDGCKLLQTKNSEGEIDGAKALYQGTKKGVLSIIGKKQASSTQGMHQTTKHPGALTRLLGAEV